MTSSNGNIFCITGHLCSKFTGHRWIPCTKASDVELWCFSLICTWINGWINNHEAGYDVTVMISATVWFNALWPSDMIWVNIGADNGLVHNGTVSLPEPMLTDHQWGLVAIPWVQFHSFNTSVLDTSLKFHHLRLHLHFPGANELIIAS